MTDFPWEIIANRLRLIPVTVCLLDRVTINQYFHIIVFCFCFINLALHPQVLAYLPKPTNDMYNISFNIICTVYTYLVDNKKTIDRGGGGHHKLHKCSIFTPSLLCFCYYLLHFYPPPPGSSVPPQLLAQTVPLTTHQRPRELLSCGRALYIH